MEAHENPTRAALREVREEIGVEVSWEGDLVGIYTVDRGDTRSGMGFVFRGRIIQGEIKRLIDSDMLYTPEYNLACIEDRKKGRSCPLGVVGPLSW